ncbi:hypothetical protein FS837_008919 [Tulasnella sp. UAMH 9824]|nr:hypothetical protein FS837_008919 [Tulasnella sp. UAMH 9824]
MGINAFDTANLYSNGLSEVILGKAIKQYNLPRDEIVVMTKLWGTVGRSTSDALAWASQEELGQKRHRFDYNTPIEETMQALDDVVKAGYVRYIGMSSCYAWQFHKMQNYAREHNLTQFISMQNFHNAVYREEEREMVPLLQDLGVGMIPWSPLAGGLLTRRVSGESVRGQTDPVAEIAENRGVSMAQVALAWSLSKPFVSAPIVGTTSLDKLKDLVEGVRVKLTEEEIKAIDDLYRPRAISGHR